ncbi:hypothetical protein M8C21_026793, partial [Ambrosia artemisiifolia]
MRRVDLERYKRSPSKPYIRLSSNTAFRRILYVSMRSICAVLSGITFDEARYNSFIDLQDKLHQNICSVQDTYIY